MNFTVNVAIHFFRGDDPRISYDNNAPDNEKPMVDAEVLCHFTLRTLTNLAATYTDWASNIAKELVRIGEWSRKIASWDEEQIVALFSKYSGRRYEGKEGTRRFVAQLVHLGDRYRFHLESKGFGLLKLEYGRLSRAAVMTLWSHLGIRNLRDRYYLESLCRVAGVCGSLYTSGELSTMTEHDAAVKALAMGLGRHLSELSAESPREERLRRAAEQGDPQAQIEIGQAHDGKGEYKEAVEWYRKAAEQDYPDGLRLLGDMYREGLGVAKDLAKAVEFYRKGAEKGDSWSQYNLATSYMQGSGVARDATKALEWFTKAAVQGLVWAQVSLGHMYKRGDGVQQDYRMAADWYQKAAAEGDPIAQNELGTMYQKGDGIAKNPEKAAEWYLKAAEQGNARAQYNLALLYEEGIGVPQDRSEALRWQYEAATR